MGFFKYGILPYKQYAKFSGRASRKEFWCYFCIYCLISFFIALFLTLTKLASDATMQLILNIFILANIIPTMALYSRRLHDTNRRVWWIFVPFYGAIVAYFFASEKGPNRFGDCPATPAVANN
jgi:uncharacterized membrane protein YhaH (DUF805 family)